MSNHSYADIAGWYFDDSQNRWEFWGAPGDTVDNKFGLYDQDAQIWDSIAYNAPFYLIAKAGGNNRGETGPRRRGPLLADEFVRDLCQFREPAGGDQ